MSYEAAADRYDTMQYNRCGRSGLKLPAVALGCWHNFGEEDDHETMRRLLTRALDLGVTHIDLANNYGPPPGSAEENVGHILREQLGAYRDELIISSKAGYLMWPGPYGEWGSRKYILASLDQSLYRLRLDYVDIFYSHRPDPETPLIETIGALATAVRQGKALYAGVSNYGPEATREACALARDMGIPLVVHQPCYNMLNTNLEDSGLIDTCAEEGLGIVAFSPLAQGLLTNRYLNGILPDSRAARPGTFLDAARVTPKLLKSLQQLDSLARSRGQTLAQLAITWVLRDPRVTAALVGASKVSQLEDTVKAAHADRLTDEETTLMRAILAGTAA